MKLKHVLALGFSALVLAAPAASWAQRNSTAAARTPHVRDLRFDRRNARPPEAGTGVIVLSARSTDPGRNGGTTTFALLVEAAEEEQPAADAAEPSEPNRTETEEQARRRASRDETRRLIALGADQVPTMGYAGRERLSISGKNGRGNNDSRLRVYKAFQAPPGRYVLLHYQAGYTATSNPGRQFCFGTLSFELHAGEVLYVGDYVGRGDADPVIDYDINDARAALASAPTLQGALQPAQMSENTEFVCYWADMTRFALTDFERARLVAGGAMTAPAPVAETVAADAEAVAGEAEAAPEAEATPEAAPAEPAPQTTGSPN